MLLVVLSVLRRIEGDGAKTPTGSAFKLTHALGMASIIALMSLLAAWLQHVFGEVGVLLDAVCMT
jgi:hypothetical protein